MSLSSTLLNACQKANLNQYRGGWRLEQALRRLADLVPISIGQHSLYLDVVQPNWQVDQLIDGEPFSTHPHEPDLQWLARKFIRPGNVVYDIGANLGLHALLFSELVGDSGKLYLFEPNPRLCRALRRSFTQPNATILPLALSSEDGTATFYLPEDHSMASLASWKENSSSITCETKRLDSLSCAAPNFIKIDVEGAEPLVLRGAMETIRKSRPVVVFEELIPATKKLGFAQGTAIQLIQEAGNYRPFLLENAQLIPLPDNRPECCEIVMLPEHLI